MNNPSERSRVLFESGYYCAESVLLAVAEHRNIACKLIPGIATGFCSGLARTDGPCGALAGAVLAVGLALGRRSAEEPLEACYEAVREVRDGFITRFGSDNCEALTGCRLGTEEGQRRFRERKQHARCLDYVAEATELALQAMARHRS